MIIFAFIATLIIFLFTVTILAAFLIILAQEFLYRGKPNAPFVPVPDESLPEIAQHIQVTKDSVVYDLGSGDGKILRALYDRYHIGKFVGIDRGVIPYIISRIRQRHVPGMSFQRKDFFDVDVSSATLVVTYLFPQLMDILLPKLQKELRSGTRLYSVDFQFKEKSPVQKIVLSDTRGVRGRVLYVYEF